MSYDFALEKKKGQPFNYESLKKDIKTLEPLAFQEMVFGDEFPEVSSNQLTPLAIAEIKYDKETKKAYREFLADKGIKLTFLDRVLKRVDLKLAAEFWKTQEEEENDSVLSVYAKGSNEEKLLIYRQLQELAIKHKLMLFNPQYGKYVNLKQDPSKLVL